MSSANVAMKSGTWSSTETTSASQWGPFAAFIDSKRRTEKRRGWARIPIIRDAGQCTIPRMTTSRTYISRARAAIRQVLGDYVGGTIRFAPSTLTSIRRT